MTTKKMVLKGKLMRIKIVGLKYVLETDLTVPTTTCNPWDFFPLFRTATCLMIDVQTTTITSEDDPEADQALQQIFDTLQIPTDALLHAKSKTLGQTVPTVDVLAYIATETLVAESVLLDLKDRPISAICFRL